MMGVFAVALSARSRRMASMPEIFGNWMSMRIRSGSLSSATATPASPSCASISWYGVPLSRARTILRFISLSST